MPLMTHARFLTLIHRVYETYKSLLMIRADYPLSLIYSTKNLAKKISHDEDREDKVSLVGPEKNIAILGQITVKPESFGELYRKVKDEAKEIQEDLFGGIGFEDEEWFGFKAPEYLVDEVNSTRPGFCFGDTEHCDMMKYGDRGLKVLFHHPRLKDRYGCVLPDGTFRFNAFACHEFLRLASLARSKLATAVHVSIGGPPRGTEIVANYLRNHPQGDRRNVKIVDGDLCLVGGYNKTSSVVSTLRHPCPVLSN